jgi:ABC-type transporter Mla subunit MlaD
MDAVRRAKIEVLIPILEAVEDAVHGIFVEEEDALDATSQNLRETAQAQRSEDAFDALNTAWDNITAAVDELKKAIGLEQPDLPATPAKPIHRRL